MNVRATPRRARLYALVLTLSDFPSLQFRLKLTIHRMTRSISGIGAGKLVRHYEKESNSGEEGGTVYYGPRAFPLTLFLPCSQIFHGMIGNLRRKLVGRTRSMEIDTYMFGRRR